MNTTTMWDKLDANTATDADVIAWATDLFAASPDAEFELRRNFEIGSRAGQPKWGYAGYFSRKRGCYIVKKAVVRHSDGYPIGTDWPVIAEIAQAEVTR